MGVHVCVGICAIECRCLQSPEEGVKVIMWVLGTKQVRYKAVHALDH